MRATSGRKHGLVCDLAGQLLGPPVNLGSQQGQGREEHEEALQREREREREIWSVSLATL